MTEKGILHFERTWGAEPAGEGAWRFALWAPQAQEVAVEVEGRRHGMTRDHDGYHRATVPAEAGETYIYLVDEQRYPDPAARAQAGDVHAPSRLVDPRAHRWVRDWSGRAWEEAVIYEMHVGTFTPEGTFAAAAKRMHELADLGITAIELMPVAQFSGDRGWGYDGVLPYAPHPAYGMPEEMKQLVEAAQSCGLMVLLDVVYNHFGPDGAYLHAIAPDFFDEDRHTPWGAGIDYIRPQVRRFFIENALYWLHEYRLDGLRLDAVDQIRDPSDPELLVEIAQEVRRYDFDRPIHLTTEDNRNITRLHDPDADLYTGEWNDDYHHAVHCLLTGESESYYQNFAVDPMADLCKTLAEGYVEQGQTRDPMVSARGEPSGHLPWTVFVNCNQNHDQVGNRAQGDRLIMLAKEPKALRVTHALLLTSPFIPMLFMGEERGATNPFQFFVDFHGELAEGTRKGRESEFADFADFQGRVPDPNDPATFERSRPKDGPEAGEWLAMTKGLLEFRQARIVPLMKSGRAGDATCERTSDRSLTARWPFADGTLTIRANFGTRPEGAADVPHADYAWGNVARDDHAIAVSIT
ncbi:malto-oligosyltrehalose trehalohydrolase [Tranquillimonas alkanivorans]|uniref:Malto-oligosyltrehalose trehalohydrolase n=1 Tax=Tranquillimonas alkanivorans TaxID=441119 RepID=A0A1I5P0J6_9RHOB|nr:malto-oligosyltrehalose trehalohydrolase [Tranquillimonas alkanivorans]SFP27638.1 maltooligosyl trehalose hydrolase [Tranquillimonas alkanivorans]